MPWVDDAEFARASSEIHRANQRIASDAAELAELRQIAQAAGQHVQQLNAEAERNGAANAHALHAVDARGRRDFGAEQWNGAMQRFRREEQDISGYEAMLAAVPIKPNQAAMHAHTMATDAGYREQFKSASLERRQAMIVEHAKQHSSYGYTSPLPEPRTAEEFRQTAGAGFDDDRDWSRAFDQSYGAGRRDRRK